MSETQVFKETYFSYTLAPKHKPTANLLLRETAIRSSCASKTGRVGLKDITLDSKVEPSEGILKDHFDSPDFYLKYRLKTSHSESCIP